MPPAAASSPPAEPRWPRTTPHNSEANHRFSSNQTNPKCKDCRRTLEAAEAGDISAIVICSEDGSDTAEFDARRCLDFAEELAARLGPAWQPQVWENLGWHWSVRCCGFQVYPGRDDYSAMLGHAHDYGAKFSARGKTPEEAIRAVLDVAEREVVQLQAMILTAFRNTYTLK